MAVHSSGGCPVTLQTFLTARSGVAAWTQPIPFPSCMTMYRCRIEDPRVSIRERPAELLLGIPVFSVSKGRTSRRVGNTVHDVPAGGEAPQTEVLVRRVVHL